jgi:hypothetical protein
MNARLIAPCGMNCSLCKAYLRAKNTCPGCRESDDKKPVSCRHCRVKCCVTLSEKGWRFCSDSCGKYPCDRLKALDKRYRAKYLMSMIDNLESIRNEGIRKFLAQQSKRWIREGKVFCVHDRQYYPIKRQS